MLTVANQLKRKEKAVKPQQLRVTLGKFTRDSHVKEQRPRHFFIKVSILYIP